MADDGSYEEAVVCDFSSLLHTSSTEVELHFVVGTGDGRQLEVPHAVELQLKR